MLAWAIYSEIPSQETKKQGSEMAQRVRASASKPDNPSSVPGIGTAEGENRLP